VKSQLPGKGGSPLLRASSLPILYGRLFGSDHDVTAQICRFCVWLGG